MHYVIKVKRIIEDAAWTNYLDDFLVAAMTKFLCTVMLTEFLSIHELLGIPISLEKTEWPDSLMTFLGILLDGRQRILAIPEEKRIKALNTLQNLVGHKKGTVKELQSLAGLFNFLNKAIMPGRAFTRRVYSILNLLKSLVFCFNLLMAVGTYSSSSHYLAITL